MLVQHVVTRGVFTLAFILSILSIVPFFRILRRGQWPRITDFASVSIAVFYGIGAFPDFFDPRPVDELHSLFSQPAEVCLISAALVALTPWILRFGSLLMCPRYLGPSVARRLALPRCLRRPFLWCAMVACVVVAGCAVQALMSARAVWTMRADTGEAWGPLIIVFYVPLSILAFLISTSEIHSRLGRVGCVVAFVCSIVAAIPVGERTLALLPVVLVLMFTPRLSVRRFVVVPAVAIIAAALLLPVFKVQFDGEDASAVNLVASTIRADLSRTSVLGEAMVHADLLGSHWLPYPMAGYVYSAFLFVPRTIAPWKGYSTAQAFTGEMTKTEPEQTYWGYGVGLIEEIIVNGGPLLVIPMLLVYGMVMGLVDQIRYPPMVLISRLSVLWLGGYSLSALVQTFGPMALISSAVLVTVAVGNRFTQRRTR